MSGGWGWDGNALPIGTEAQAGGVGRRASWEQPSEGGETRRTPRRERGGGRGKTAPRAVGRSEEPAARGCPAALPRPSHKGAQGPRFLLALPPSRPRPAGPAPVTAARAGLWAPAPAGVVRPCRPHPPSRPGGSVTPRPWPPAGSCVSPPPQRGCSPRGKGAGAVRRRRRRRPQGLLANPPLGLR